MAKLSNYGQHGWLGYNLLSQMVGFWLTAQGSTVSCVAVAALVLSSCTVERAAASTPHHSEGGWVCLLVAPLNK